MRRGLLAFSLVTRAKGGRLEINLAAGEAAGIKTRSRVLALADVVKRK